MARSTCHRGTAPKEARLHVARWIGFESSSVGLLPARRGGVIVEQAAAPPDGEGLAALARRVTDRHGPVVVRAAIESMNGARFVHDTLERRGWEIEVADAQKVKGLAPLACKTDRIDAWVLAELSRRALVPAIWLPGFEQRQERERARRWLFLVATATSCNKARLGRQRGAKVAQVDIARRLAGAIWHMLTRNQPFAPAGATRALAA